MKVIICVDCHYQIPKDDYQSIAIDCPQCGGRRIEQEDTEVQNEVKCKKCNDIIPTLNTYPNGLCDSCYMKLEVQNER